MLTIPIKYIVLLVILSAEPDSIPIIRDAALEGWQGDTGLWAPASDAVLKPDDPSLLEAIPGRGVLVNGPLGKTTNLTSEMLHADMQLHIEFMIPKDATSGVYLMSRYELQIVDSYGNESLSFSDCGGIYQRFDESRQRGWEGRAPLVNASKAPGEWQSFDITFRAPRFNDAGKKTQHARFVKVVLNGQVIHENVEVTGPTRGSKYSNEEPLGALMLQGGQGCVAYRNIDVVHLNLD